MSEDAGRDQAARSHRELPEPVRLEDTIAEQAASDPADPTWGRDTEWEYSLRHIGG